MPDSPATTDRTAPGAVPGEKLPKGAIPIAGGFYATLNFPGIDAVVHGAESFWEVRRPDGNVIRTRSDIESLATALSVENRSLDHTDAGRDGEER